MPTTNPILIIFLRSMFIFITLVWGFNWTLKDAYWVAIFHDSISLLNL
jgi:hypothetical protein